MDKLTTEQQLERANRIIGWMVPYLGSMCPPDGGLMELNEHCCENRVPESGPAAKERPIRQRSAPPNVVDPAPYKAKDAADALTVRQADALRRIRDRGPGAWDAGSSRAGGAISRMFDRLRDAGMVTAPPYRVTSFGRRALKAYDRKAKR